MGGAEALAREGDRAAAAVAARDGTERGARWVRGRAPSAAAEGGWPAALGGGVRSPPSPGARRPPGGALRESSRFLTVSRRSAGINPAVDPVGAPSARRRPFPHSRGQGSDGASPSSPARVELPVLGPFRLSPAGGRREAFVSSPPAGLGPSPDPGARGAFPFPLFRARVGVVEPPPHPTTAWGVGDEPPQI